MRCGDCGARLARDARYCVACGAPGLRAARPEELLTSRRGAAAPAPPRRRRWPAERWAGGGWPAPLRRRRPRAGGADGSLTPSGALATVLAYVLGLGLLIGSGLGGAGVASSPSAIELGLPGGAPRAGGADRPRAVPGDDDAATAAAIAAPPEPPVSAAPPPPPAPTGFAPAPLSPPAGAAPIDGGGGGGGGGGGELPAASGGERPRGIVVHARARLFTLALERGELRSVHAAAPPEPGTQVELSAERLRNGTFRSDGLVEVGESDGALVRGTVTYVDVGARAYVVSAPGVSMAVRAPLRSGPPAATDLGPPAPGTAAPPVVSTPPPAATSPPGSPSPPGSTSPPAATSPDGSPSPPVSTSPPAWTSPPRTAPSSAQAPSPAPEPRPGPPPPGKEAAPPPPGGTPPVPAPVDAPIPPDRRLPTPGSEVTVQVRIERGTDEAGGTKLVEQALVKARRGRPELPLSGRLAAVDSERRLLELPADDAGELDAKLSVRVPERLELGALRAGDELVLLVRRLPDGSLELVRAHANSGPAAADDPRRALGRALAPGPPR